MPFRSDRCMPCSATARFSHTVAPTWIFVLACSVLGVCAREFQSINIVYVHRDLLNISARSRRIGGGRVLEVRFGNSPRCGRGLLVRVESNLGVFPGVRRLLHELWQLCVVVSLCRAQIRLKSHHIGLQLCSAFRRSVKNHVLLFQKTILGSKRGVCQRLSRGVRVG